MRQLDRDDAFTAFVRTYRARLVRLGRLLTAGDEAAAEDLVQTSLTKIYLAWPSVQRADAPLKYAQRVLSNTFIDESRRAHRRREVPDELRLADETAAPGHDHEQRAAVLEALSELAPRQRAVVVLRHWLDLDVETTAAALGCSAGTVKSQNSKALQHLQASLAVADLDPAMPVDAGVGRSTTH